MTSESQERQEMMIKNEEEEENKRKKKYDVIVVGAGPGGFMTAYQLSLTRPDLRHILVLEGNEATLEEYVKKGYGDVSRYIDAMQDKTFSQTLISTDKKTVWIGRGNGGGTLHFGVQFIDTPDLVQKSYPEWSADFEAVARLLGPQTYETPPSEAWRAIESNLEDYRLQTDPALYKLYRNHVYATSLTEDTRLLLGSFLASRPNVSLQHGVLVDRVLWKEGTGTEDGLTAEGVVDARGNSYFADIVVLSAGSIRTPAILQRSGVGPSDVLTPLNIPVRKELPVGATLRDHAGLNFTYQASSDPATSPPLPIPPPMSIHWDATTLQQIHEKTGKYLYAVTGPSVPRDDQNKIFDFSNWVNRHPGGPRAIQQWTRKGYILHFPHDTSRWYMNRQNFDPPLGTLNQTTPVADLPPDLQALFAPVVSSSAVPASFSSSSLSLESDTIVGYLQTRNPPAFSWQTYWNAIPHLDKTPLIVTYALSTVIPDRGSVRITSRDPSVFPAVALNELDADGVAFLLDGVQTTEPALIRQGWSRLDPSSETVVTPEFVKEKYDSIYHYHGTCPMGTVTDDSGRVQGSSNLYIADLSVLPKPWGGSISVPSLVVGYRTANHLSSTIIDGN